MVSEIAIVVAAYLLGAIVSTYTIGRLAVNYTMPTEGDDHIGAAVICSRLGSKLETWA